MSGNIDRKAPTCADGEFHLIKPDYSEHSLLKALKKGEITEDDYRLIKEHVADIRVTNDISVGRVNKITYHLVGWGKFLRSFRDRSIQQIKMAISDLKDARFNGHRYKQNTLRDFISILKKFYVWLVENGYSACTLEQIQKIKVPQGDTMTKTAGQMLTEEEIHAMIGACKRSMDRALLTVLYEGGLRIKEVGTLTWDQVTFKENRVVINVNIKTGIPRRIPLFNAAE